MTESTHSGYSAFSPGHTNSSSPVHLLLRAGQKEWLILWFYPIQLLHNAVAWLNCTTAE